MAVSTIAGSAILLTRITHPFPRLKDERAAFCAARSMFAPQAVARFHSIESKLAVERDVYAERANTDPFESRTVIYFAATACGHSL
jgi:hypothetical protein